MYQDPFLAATYTTDGTTRYQVGRILPNLCALVCIVYIDFVKIAIYSCHSLIIHSQVFSWENYYYIRYFSWPVASTLVFICRNSLSLELNSCRFRLTYCCFHTHIRLPGCWSYLNCDPSRYGRISRIGKTLQQWINSQ